MTVLKGVLRKNVSAGVRHILTCLTQGTGFGIIWASVRSDYVANSGIERTVSAWYASVLKNSKSPTHSITFYNTFYPYQNTVTANALWHAYTDSEKLSRLHDKRAASSIGRATDS